MTQRSELRKSLPRPILRRFLEDHFKNSKPTRKNKKQRSQHWRADFLRDWAILISEPDLTI
jgi:hypothetical protein